MMRLQRSCPGLFRGSCCSSDATVPQVWILWKQCWLEREGSRCCVVQGLVPDKALSRELTQARREDIRTPGATPLTTPGRTPSGSPRGSAPSTPFRKIPE